MSNEHFDVILAGNHLTTLVAASGIAEAGKRVCVINPLPTWGGHFTMLPVNGMIFDPGAVSHEFTAFSDGDVKNALEYNPRRRNDCSRFHRLIEEFTRSQIDLVRMKAPQTVYGGELVPDIVMSNRLDVLHHPAISGRIRAEQDDISRSISDEMHPRHKKTSELFLKRSYYHASVLNHGATLHSAIFEPMFYKMSFRSTTHLIALYHRIAWLPLYYPETLRSQFGDVPQQLPDTYFCYPRAGYIGAFGEALVHRMRDASVTIIRERIDTLESGIGKHSFVLKNGRRIESPCVIWSLAHDQLYTAVTGAPRNQFDKWSTTLVFVTIARRKLAKSFSVLYAPDDRMLFYRASNQSDSAGLDEDPMRIVIEVNPDYANALGHFGEGQISSRVQADLFYLRIVDNPHDVHILGSRTLKDVVLLPSAENCQRLEKERDVLLDRYPGIIFTRNVEAVFADTLNDQIIKGLKLVEEFGTM